MFLMLSQGSVSGKMIYSYMLHYILFHYLMWTSEVMNRILWQSSLLRVDDVSLKASSSHCFRFCQLCNRCAPDDALHLVLQCQSLQPEIEALFLQIRDSLCDYGRNL